MATCRLCLQQTTLRNSHIVPEFLYAQLYNDKGHMMGINGLGRKGWKPLQQGLREPLFCELCEQHFNEYCEKPFRAQWILNSPLPSPWVVPEPYEVQVDYASFKLFHLSVLFRAGVSSLPTFAEVALGPHEECLRQMLLRKDPGQFWQYPVVGLVLLHHETRKVVQMISKAVQGRLAGMRCYATIYGGVQWWVGVSSQRNAEFESIAVRSDGRIPMTSIAWNELAIMKSASSALRNAQP